MLLGIPEPINPEVTFNRQQAGFLIVFTEQLAKVSNVTGLTPIEVRHKAGQIVNDKLETLVDQKDQGDTSVRDKLFVVASVGSGILDQEEAAKALRHAKETGVLNDRSQEVLDQVVALKGLHRRFGHSEEVLATGISRVLNKRLTDGSIEPSGQGDSLILALTAFGAGATLPVSPQYVEELAIGIRRRRKD